jgi:excisionase family DNA binding protein
MQQLSAGSHGLLTARQVQQLLHIDRSTVYRMASDGRLPAIRVGKQLRFPADRLGGLLGTREPREDVDPATAEAVIEVAADLLGVTMVVTDMAGRPVTAIANPSPCFVANARGEALAACLAEWRAMADDPDLAPRFVMAEPGFQCARAFIRSGSTLIGMVLAGGVSAGGVSAEGGSEADASQFHRLDDQQRQRVLRALPRVAAALGSQFPTSTSNESVALGTLPSKESA